MWFWPRIFTCIALLCAMMTTAETEQSTNISGRLNFKISTKPEKLEKGKLTYKLTSSELRRDKRERKEDEKLTSTSPSLSISPKTKTIEEEMGRRIQKRNKDNFQIIQD